MTANDETRRDARGAAAARLSARPKTTWRPLAAFAGVVLIGLAGGACSSSGTTSDGSGSSGGSASSAPSGSTVE